MYTLIDSQLDTKLQLLTNWLIQDNECKLKKSQISKVSKAGRSLNIGLAYLFTVYKKNSSTSSKPTFLLRLCFVIIFAAAALLNFVTQKEKL